MSKNEIATTSTVPKEIDQSKKRKQRLLGGIFVTTVAGTSAGLAFWISAAATKKYHTPSPKNKPPVDIGARKPKFVPQSAKTAAALDTGALGLAVRALGWGTLWAVAGVGTLTLGVSLLLGVHNLKEFRQSMENFFKSHVPVIPRNKVQGRSDFKTFHELFEYIDKGEESLPKKVEPKD